MMPLRIQVPDMTDEDVLPLDAPHPGLGAGPLVHPVIEGQEEPEDVVLMPQQAQQSAS